MVRLLVLCIVIVAATAMNPGKVHVVRSTTVAAPTSVLHDELAEGHAWSPLDVRVCAAEVRVVEASATRIVMDLDIGRPRRLRYRSTFALLPHAHGQTWVSWTADGVYTFWGDLSGFFASSKCELDQAVLDAVLATLKTSAERVAGAQAAK